MKEIKDKFIKVIQHSQCIEYPDVDDLFARWESAKSRFINKFGGQLIYEVGEVSFGLDEQIKRTKVQTFADNIGSSYDNYALAEFIEANAECFYDNTVKNAEKWEDIGVKAGMKLIKAFKFFESNKELLDYFQSEASRIIQENKIEGTLCYSVHPLDFLSVSANAHNWRSCHALDGEYCAGNLSYMVDDVTFIAYVKSKTDGKIVGFPESVPWNSKKWRVMLYLDKDETMMYSGKQYPFSSNTLYDKVRRDVVIDLLDDYITSWSPWVRAATSIRFERPNGELYDFGVRDEMKVMNPRGDVCDLGDTIRNGDGALQFNDVLDSSSYIPCFIARLNSRVSFFNFEEEEEYKPIEVGGEVMCLRCGRNALTHHDIMQCDECEREYGSKDNSAYVTCDCCGGRHLRDEITYDLNGDAICSGCLEVYYFQCPRCGEYCPTNDMKYMRDTDERICYLCAEEEEEE